MHPAYDTFFFRNIFYRHIGEGHPLILLFLILTEERIKFLGKPFGISGNVLVLQRFHQRDQCVPEIPDSKAQLGYQTHCLDKQLTLFLFPLCICLCDLLRRKYFGQILVQPSKILTCKGWYLPQKIHHPEDIFGCGHHPAQSFIIWIPVLVQVIHQFHHRVSQFQKLLQNRIGKIQNIQCDISGIGRFKAGAVEFLFIFIGYCQKAHIQPLLQINFLCHGVIPPFLGLLYCSKHSVRFDGLIFRPPNRLFLHKSGLDWNISFLSGFLFLPCQTIRPFFADFHINIVGRKNDLRWWDRLNSKETIFMEVIK